MCRLSRSQTFVADQVGAYHAFNRTVRRSYLHGVDPLTGTDYSYRRKQFRNRMQQLSQFFCIDVLAFSILSNHWHCVLRNRPDQVQALSDREVAFRWLSLTSRKRCQDRQGGEIQECEITQVLSNPQRVAELRSRLSNISWFIRLMCQTIARQCNLEDECTGRFFEERFKLNRLEDEADVLACMAYVDLNPLRAGMADSLDDYAEVSIGERMRTLDEGLPDTSLWLAPVEQPVESDNPATGEEQICERVGESTDPATAATGQEELRSRLGCIPMTLEAYERLLWHLALESRPELQASVTLTKQRLQTPVCLDGKPVNIADLAERHRSYGRRCQTQLGERVCRAVRARAATARPNLRQQPPQADQRTPSSTG